MGGLDPPTQGNKHLCLNPWVAGSRPAMESRKRCNYLTRFSNNAL
jgi:hypothetical protein